MRSITFISACSIIFGCCAAVLTSADAADQLKVELADVHDELHVTVTNESNQSIRVNTRLANGPNFGLWELYLDVRDEHGQQIEYAMKSTIDPPKASDWQELQPHHFVGVHIPLDWLGLEYDLTKGEYVVMADYRVASRDGYTLQTYRSNALRVIIERDRDQQAADLKRRGELYDVNLGLDNKEIGSKPKPQ